MSIKKIKKLVKKTKNKWFISIALSNICAIKMLHKCSPTYKRAKFIYNSNFKINGKLIYKK